jgi:hypothetical protein
MSGSIGEKAKWVKLGSCWDFLSWYFLGVAFFRNLNHRGSLCAYRKIHLADDFLM